MPAAVACGDASRATTSATRLRLIWESQRAWRNSRCEAFSERKKSGSKRKNRVRVKMELIMLHSSHDDVTIASAKASPRITRDKDHKRGKKINNFKAEKDLARGGMKPGK